MVGPKKSGSQRKGPEGLRALDRAMSILYSLADHPRGLSLADLARETGLTTTTAHRMLAALRAKDLVREAPDGKHALGIGTLMLSGPYLAGLDLRTEARPHLESLNEQYNEACHLGVLASPHIVYIDKIASTHPVRMVSRLGAAMPAIRTAMGKALLAQVPHETTNQVLHDTRTQLDESIDEKSFIGELAAVRDRGYAFDLEENEPGICCVGAALHDNTGRAIAAISVSGPRERINQDIADELGQSVTQCASDISEALGYLAPGVAPDRRRSLVNDAKSTG